MGGHSEDNKFVNLYEQTMQFYSALFKEEKSKVLWESLDERFANEVFSCSLVSLHRLANISLYTALLPHGDGSLSQLRKN